MLEERPPPQPTNPPDYALKRKLSRSQSQAGCFKEGKNGQL